jgi:hypothetical protein
VWMPEVHRHTRSGRCASCCILSPPWLPHVDAWRAEGGTAAAGTEEELDAGDDGEVDGELRGDGDDRHR